MLFGQELPVTSCSPIPGREAWTRRATEAWNDKEPNRRERMLCCSFNRNILFATLLFLESRRTLGVLSTATSKYSQTFTRWKMVWAAAMDVSSSLLG
jgi:hypothetical protein